MLRDELNEKVEEMKLAEMERVKRLYVGANEEMRKRLEAEMKKVTAAANAQMRK